MEVQDTLVIPGIKMEGESGVKVNSLIMMNLGPKIQQRLMKLKPPVTTDQEPLELRINASPEAIQALVQFAYTGAIDLQAKSPHVREELLHLGINFRFILGLLWVC